MRSCRVILATLLLLGMSFGSQAEERITDYDIQVVVEANADIVVTETIRVVSEGVEIRRLRRPPGWFR